MRYSITAKKKIPNDCSLTIALLEAAIRLKSMAINRLNGRIRVPSPASVTAVIPAIRKAAENSRACISCTPRHSPTR